MFKRKNQEIVKEDILPVYSSDILKNIQSIIKKKEYTLEPVNILKFRYIGIDRIRLDINSVCPEKYTLTLNDPTINSDYMKGWKKGLGRFITEDLRNYTLSTGDSIYPYFILKDNFNSFKAFIRLITPEDYDKKVPDSSATVEPEKADSDNNTDEGENNLWAELNNHHLLNLNFGKMSEFDFHDSVKHEDMDKYVYACVMKIISGKDYEFNEIFNKWIEKVNPIDKKMKFHDIYPYQSDTTEITKDDVESVKKEESKYDTEINEFKLF